MSSPLERIASMLEPLADQPVARELLSAASAARNYALRAQEAVLGALSLPTANDVAKLERRVRSQTDEIARLEDQLDRMETRLRRAEQSAKAPVKRKA